MKIVVSFLKDESGATAIEYGLLAAIVGVALIPALTALEGGLSDVFVTDVVGAL